MGWYHHCSLTTAALEPTLEWAVYMYIGSKTPSLENAMLHLHVSSVAHNGQTWH